MDLLSVAEWLWKWTHKFKKTLIQLSLSFYYQISLFPAKNNVIENIKQTQGAKRGAKEQEEPNDESNDELEFYSDTYSKSVKGKKQKSEKTHT